MKIYFSLLAAVIFTGCTVTIPLTWASEKEAYPGGTPAESTGYSANATRQSVLNYSFADVFTSAESAMTYAQINITGSDMALGTINGSRSSLVGGYSKRFYYLMKIEEQGPEKCRVSIYSKQQQSGKYTKWLTTIILPALGLGAFSFALAPDDVGMGVAMTLCMPVLLGPFVLYNNVNSKKAAQLKWSPDDDEYLDRVMSFMRTDLLQKNN